MKKIDGYRQYELDNGLVVALQETPTKTIAGKLRVNYGSVHEEKGEEGIAHFLEHVLSTGGSSRYNKEKSDDTRSRFGYFDAGTSLGRTLFSAGILEEDLRLFMDFFSDLVFNPCFNPERVDGERRRVLREISETKSNPIFKDKQLVKKSFFRNHPAGYFGLGKENVIANVSIDDLRKFHLRGYHPNNMDLILVGALPKNIGDLIEKYFTTKPRGENRRMKFPPFEPLEQKVILHVCAPELYNNENPEESNSQVSMAFVAPSDSHEDNFTISVIEYVLGYGTNSRLYQNLGLQKGLIYSPFVDHDGSYNAGCFQIGANVPSKRQEEAIDAVFEVKKAIKYVVSHKLETNKGYLDIIEKKLDYKWTPESILSAYEAITPEQLREVAQKYLPEDREKGKYVLLIRDPLKKE